MRTLALFHHDPARSDEAVGCIVRRAREVFPTAVAAREGMRLQFSTQSEPFGRTTVTRSDALSLGGAVPIV